MLQECRLREAEIWKQDLKIAIQKEKQAYLKWLNTTRGNKCTEYIEKGDKVY
jgi:thiaminase